MIKDHYDIIRKNKLAFWWFKGRRNFLLKVLTLNTGGPAETGLDAGCGPFTNAPIYAGFAKRWLALDHSSESFREMDPDSSVLPLIGDLSRLPVKRNRVDMVLLLDVLEHIKDDRAVLSELKGVLRKGGFLLISVPAFQCLWSRHDEQAGHERRYKRKMLEALCGGLGYEIVCGYYFNTALFLPIYLIRKVLKLLPAGRKTLEANLSPGFADPFLSFLLGVEMFINFRLVRLPFGTSFVILLRKNDV